MYFFPTPHRQYFFQIHVQPWTFAYVRLLNKPYENEVTLREQKIPLKFCQPLDFWYAF